MQMKSGYLLMEKRPFAAGKCYYEAFASFTDISAIVSTLNGLHEQERERRISS